MVDHVTQLRRYADKCYSGSVERLGLNAAADRIESLERSLARAGTENTSLRAQLEGMGRWVPVAERLPDRSGMYLIWDGEDYEAARWNDGDFYRLFGEEPPTHWMPVRLEPPEQGTRGLHGSDK